MAPRKGQAGNPVSSIDARPDASLSPSSTLRPQSRWCHCSPARRGSTASLRGRVARLVFFWDQNFKIWFFWDFKVWRFVFFWDQSMKVFFFWDQSLKIWVFFTTLMVFLISLEKFFLSFFCQKSDVFGYFYAKKIGDVVFENENFGKRFPGVRKNLTTLLRSPAG